MISVIDNIQISKIKATTRRTPISRRESPTARVKSSCRLLRLWIASRRCSARSQHLFSSNLVIILIQTIIQPSRRLIIRINLLYKINNFLLCQIITKIIKTSHKMAQHQRISHSSLIATLIKEEINSRWMLHHLN